MFASDLQKGNFRDIKLLFSKRFNEKSNIWVLDNHTHRFMEFMYFLDGNAYVHGERGEMVLSIFDLIVYPEKSYHKLEIDLSNRQEVICLGFELPCPSGIRDIFTIQDLDDKLRWLFIEIDKQSNSSDKERFPLLESLISVLFHYIRQCREEDGTNSSDPLQRVIHYLHCNLSGKIEMTDLAAIANYSESYLSRSFKERTGMTPLRYLENIRLSTASHLLRRKDKNIAEIGRLVGYDDPKYFSTRFTAKYGMSPRQYR